MSDLFKKYSIQRLSDYGYTQHYFNDVEIYGTSICEGEEEDFCEAVSIICEQADKEIKTLEAEKADLIELVKAFDSATKAQIFWYNNATCKALQSMENSIVLKKYIGESE